MAERDEEIDYKQYNEYKQYNSCEATPNSINESLSDEDMADQIKECRDWYDDYRELSINPKTNRKIKRGNRAWNLLEEKCQSIIYKIDHNSFEVKDTSTNFKYPTDINELYRDIKYIVTANWDNSNLSKRSTYNSDDGVDDLFTVDDIRSSLEDPSNSKILVLEKDDKTDSEGPKVEDRDYDPDLEGFGQTDAKKPLMDCATDFNTFYFIGTMETRLRFIDIVIKSFKIYLEEIYKKVPTLNEETYNIMFKGGSTVRFLLKELIFNFFRNIENHMTSNINKNIKLSDYDFEMILNKDSISDEVFVKLNILTYLVTLRIRNYLDKHKTLFFNFFQLIPSIQQEKLGILRNKMQTEIDQTGATIKTIRNDIVKNFYEGIEIDYVELSSNCQDGGNRILNNKVFEINDPVLVNIDGENQSGIIIAKTDGTKKKGVKYTIKLTATNSEVDNILKEKLSPDLNKYKNKSSNNPQAKLVDNKSNCRTDFALILDPNENKSLDGVAISFITANQLFKKYNINNKSSNFCIKNKQEGSQFYVTHNPIIENREKNLKFQLNRIKYSYTIYFKKKGKYYKDYIPGEILDLSCPYKTDRKVAKYNEVFSKNKYLQKYNFLNYQISFYSYSIWGHITDTTAMLFIEPDHKPWVAGKADKRICRLLYLSILYFFTCHFRVLGKSNIRLSFRKKLNYVKKLLEMIKNDFPTKSKFSIELLEELRKHLYKVSKYRYEYKKEYKIFKADLVKQLGDLINTIQTEYTVTRQPDLSIGPIDSNVLNISDPSVYKLT